MPVTGPMRVRSVAVVLVAALVAASCMSTTPALTKVGSPPYVAGSGAAASSTRALPAFDAIDASSSVRVRFASGETNEAVVTTDDNLLSYVVTEVRNGTLHVAIEGSIETRLLPTVVVTAFSPMTSLVATSAAEIEASGLDLDRLTASVSAAARVKASGRVGNLVLHVLAGSSAELRDLAVETADVTLSSAATAFLRVTGSVDGSCLASSTLHLIGRPATQTVATDVSSSVEVE